MSSNWNSDFERFFKAVERNRTAEQQSKYVTACLRSAGTAIFVVVFAYAVLTAIQLYG